MKSKLILIALAGSLFLLAEAGTADNEGKYYVGLQQGFGDYDEDGISETYNPTLLMARLGGYLTPNFTIEGRLGSGLKDDTHKLPEFGNNNFSLELDSLLGVYGTGHFNLSEKSSVYGVLGGSKVEGTSSLPDFTSLESSEDNSGISYGIGVDIGFGSSWILNIEYMRYLDDDNFNLDVGSIGVAYRF